MFGLKNKVTERKNPVSPLERRRAEARKRLGLAVSQERVLKTIQELQPCHYRQISQKLHVIEGCITPRIAELKKQKLIKVSVFKPGMAGVKVAHYSVTHKGFKRIREITL